jgi:hypothetical protein
VVCTFMRIDSTIRTFALVGCVSTVVAVLLSSTSCQPHNSLAIQMGTPVRFSVSAPGTLTSLQVSGPDLDRESYPQGEGDHLTLLKVYWELAPREGTYRTLDQIESITYGKVPDGFIQVQPPSGVPPPLQDGNLYNIRFSVNDGNGINTFFAIRDGKIVAEGER